MVWLARARWIRLVGYGGVALSIAACSKLPHDISTGKEVSASSVCGLTPPAPWGRPRLWRVADGVTKEGPSVGARAGESTFALCTELEAHPWVQVDFGKIRRVDFVSVFGRADCCWGDSDLPLGLQLSSDGRHFETVEVRSEPFSNEDPWQVAVAGRAARYVRLYGAATQPKNIVISELQVVGR